MTVDCRRLAMEVVEAWNSHDIEAILSHYSDDFQLTSPLLKKNRGIENGTVQGKHEVMKWWQSCLEKVPDLHFDLLDIAESVDSFTLIQKNSYNNKITVSVFYLNTEGKIRKEVFYN